MNYQKVLSTWANNVKPSPTLAIDAKAKELLSKGEDICGFGGGEPDFDTPEHIKEACIKALKVGKTKYIACAGLPELRKALAEQYQTVNGIQNLTINNIVISPSGKFSCYLAILSVCNPADEIIIPAPYWVSYPEMVRLAGGVPKFITTTDKTHFKITPEQLKNAITPKTKLLILNSPSNPTGCMYTKEEMEKIVEICLSKKVLIMSDEIYEYVTYDSIKHYSPASFSKEAFENIITTSGFSKTYAMTGWRIGTLVAPEPIAKAVDKLQSHMTSNSTTFAQYGALEAVVNKEATRAALKKMLESFDRRRLKLLKGLTSIPGITCVKPDGAFYLFPNISKFGKTSEQFATELLEQQKVAVVPGIAFGAEGYIRFSYATSDEVIDKAIIRISNFCKTLNAK